MEFNVIDDMIICVLQRRRGCKREESKGREMRIWNRVRGLVKGRICVGTTQIIDGGVFDMQVSRCCKDSRMSYSQL
jgi:hypothetical protein